MAQTCEFSIPNESGTTIHAASTAPVEPHACLTLAPHSGSGMNRPFMLELGDRLADRGIATVRFDFPFMRSFSRRPDSPVVLDRVMRTVMGKVTAMFPDVIHYMGGSSFGARIAATVQARTPLEQVQGLVFLGFPLHPVNRPGTDNAKPLKKVRRPMLFLQGIGDEAADAELLEDTVRSLGREASLHWVAGNDGALRSITRREPHAGESGVADTARHIADWIERRSCTSGNPAPQAQSQSRPREVSLERLEQSISRVADLIENQRERVEAQARAGMAAGVAGELLETWCRSIDLLRWQRDLLLAPKGGVGLHGSPAQPAPSEPRANALDLDFSEWQRHGLHVAHAPSDGHADTKADGARRAV